MGTLCRSPHATRTSRPSVALALAAAAASGCSFLGLDEFEVPFCTSHAECEVINEADGVGADACLRWQCSGTQIVGEPAGTLTRGQCVLGAPDLDGDGVVATRCGGGDCDDADPRAFDGSPEACDGVDNDCDGVIDEPGDGDASPRPLATGGAPLARGLTGGSVAWSGGDPGLVASVDEVGARLAVAAGGGVAADDGWRWSDAPRTPDWRPGCATPDGSSTSSCRASAIALADAASTSVALGVTRTGCARGQLRVGTLGPDDPGALSQLGPTRRSAVWQGVDVDPAAAPQCTGARGARAPALVAFGGGPAETPTPLLATWLDEDVRGTAACGEPAPVRALALFPRLGTAGEPLRWVDASDAGVPVTLGRTLARAAAATARWEDGSVLVAWVEESQAIRLVLVPPPGPSEGDDAFGCAVLGDCDDREGVVETPFPEPIDLTLLNAGAPAVEEVAIALGPLDRLAGRQAVGVAWRTGCGGEPGIRFRRLEVVLGEGGVEPGPEGQIRALAGPADDVAAGPALAYRPGGFTVDRAAGDPFERGGWMVLWQTSTGALRGLRVGETDGDVLPGDGRWETTGERFLWPPRVSGGAPAVVTAAGDAVPLALGCGG